MANASTLLNLARRAEADPGGLSGDEEVPFSRPPDMGSMAANPPDTANSSASNASMVDSIDGLGIFVIPVLDFPANNELCSCEAIMGFVIEDNTTFVGMYGEFPFKIELKGNRSKSALSLSLAPLHYSITLSHSMPMQILPVPRMHEKSTLELSTPPTQATYYTILHFTPYPPSTS